MQRPVKILVIRFSSFGDIVQTMSVLGPLRQRFSQAEVHWLCRSDMQSFLRSSEYKIHVWPFERKSGLLGLVKLALKLRKQKITHVYDAHSNFRSRVVSFILRMGRHVEFSRRSKDRWKRFLLFWFRFNKFPKPFRGMLSYQKPLTKWGVDPLEYSFHEWSFPDHVKDKLEKLGLTNKIALAPSAAWEMKRWPLEHWKELILALDSQEFVILGGPGDHFCKKLEEIAPDRVKNLAGQLSLLESCYVVDQVALTVSADTGLLHVADLLGRKGVALIGPTAFGYTSSKLIKILEVSLPCRPCTKDGSGRCVQDVYKKCLVDIKPMLVKSEVMKLLSS
jgi:heptosyltransferase-2